MTTDKDAINNLLYLRFWKNTEEDIKLYNDFIKGILEDNPTDTFSMTDNISASFVYLRQENEIICLDYNDVKEFTLENTPYCIEYNAVDFTMKEDISNAGFLDVLKYGGVNLEEIIKYVDYEFKHLNKNSIQFIECILGFRYWGSMDNYTGEYDSSNDYIGIVDMTSIKTLDVDNYIENDKKVFRGFL